MPKNLTDIAIKRFPLPESGTVTHWDTNCKGFGIRLSPGGARTFIVLLGSGRRQKIGRYPTISLKKAREAAETILAENTLGTYQPPSIAFGTAKRKWLKACEAKNRPSTVREYTSRIKHFRFGDRKIGTITKRDVTKKLNVIATASERHHALVVAKVFFSWCASQGFLNTSPLIALKAPPKPQSRSRILTPEELKEVLTKALAAPYPFGHIVALLALTGQRRGEIASLKWEYVERDTITIPSDIAKNGVEHCFPIGTLARRVLESIPPEHKQSEFIFPASRDHVRGKKTTVFNGWGKAKKAFDKTLENVDPYTLHDLRRTFSSTLAMLGVPIHVTEKLLNHISGQVSGVAAVYNRYDYQAEMQEAINVYNDYLLKLLKNGL